VLITGVAAAGIGLPIIFTNSPGFEPFVAGIVLFIFAPVVFALAGMTSWAGPGGGSAPVFLVVLGFLAISAAPLHSLVKSRWAASASIVGFLAWILCQAFLALVAGSI
jgi:hypothetical protein